MKTKRCREREKLIYKGKILGKSVKISNEDYKQLLRRFDLKNIEEDYEEYYINVVCPFCHRYYFLSIYPPLRTTFCNSKCPFAQFETEDNVGCLNVIESFIDKKILSLTLEHLNIGSNSISWKPKIDTKIRKLITKLRNELLKMKKETKNETENIKK